MIGNPNNEVPQYRIGDIPAGLHNGQLTPDTVALNIAHLCELPFNASNAADSQGFEIHVGNPSANGECCALWVREDSLNFSQLSFPHSTDLSGNFRHPFLHNAMTVDANGQPYTSPLKKWTQNFVNALDNAYHNPIDSDHAISDPAKWRFYNDSEGDVYSIDSNSNAYFVFQQFVARRNHAYHADHSGEPIAGWWFHEKVPGRNLTLEELYQEERGKQLQAGLTVWPQDVGDVSAGGFDVNASDSERNNDWKYLKWWQNICSQARVHAFKVSFYDVIHERWRPDRPQDPHSTTPKCGNYIDSTADGFDPASDPTITSNTSWYENVSYIDARVGPNGSNFDWPETPQTLAHWQSARRNTIIRATPYQWVAYRTMSRTGSNLLSNFFTLDNRGADVDCPQLYPIDPYALTGGRGDNEWYTGWQQRNVYVDPARTWPAKTDARSLAARIEYSNLVADRMAVEASINSYPSASLPLGHYERVVPWVPMHVRASGEDPRSYSQDEGLYRGQLMMLRAKKAKELLWFNLGSRPDSAVPWEVTRELVFRVYTPQIGYIRRVAGKSAGIAQPAPVVASIEDTLRRFGANRPPQGEEYTTNILGSVFPTAGGRCPTPVNQTGLLVQFNNMDQLSTGFTPPRGPNDYVSTDIELRVEAQGLSGGQPGNVRGRVFVFNWLSLQEPELPKWYSVGTFENEDPYLLRTPDGRTHLTFQFHSFAGAPNRHAFISTTRGGASGRILVWLEQEAPASVPLESHYDLVQAVTFMAPSYGSDSALDLDPLEVLTPASDCSGPNLPLYVLAGPRVTVLDPIKSTTTPCDNCLGSPIPTLLNSEFCHLPPNCGSGDPCYTPDKNVRIVFNGAVRAAEGIDLPVFIRKVGADPTFNYASLMNVQIQRLDGVGFSDEIVISGNGTTLLVPGTYEVAPVTDSAGVIVSPLADSYSPEDATPVQPFTYYFTLLSDCNLNGREDYSEDGSVVTDINMDPSLDWWPYDHMIDACHPELCEPDYNGDGNIDQGDVDTIISMVSGDFSQAAEHADPDFNHDGNVDQADIDALVSTVAGHGCP